MMCNYSSMMMCPPSAGGGKVAGLLIAIALGYWVLTLAENQLNFLKIVGRIAGWLVMLVAFIGLLCNAGVGLCRMKSCPKEGMAMGAGHPGCPMQMGKMMPSDSDSDDNPAAAPKK